MKKKSVKKLHPGSIAIINQWKTEDPFTGHTSMHAGSTIRSRIIGRGEHMFYQKDARATLVEISARDQGVVLKSIFAWDDGTRITDVEQQEILAHIEESWGWDLDVR